MFFFFNFCRTFRKSAAKILFEKKILLEKVWQKNTFRKSMAKKILLEKVWQKKYFWKK